jgi:hypothetical protein
MLFNLKDFGVLVLLLLLCAQVKAQTAEQAQALLWFDQTVGKENAAIFNGPVYIDRFRLNTMTHPYLISDSFVTGTVDYNGQHWPGLTVLYNVHDDILILKSEGNYSGMSISLIQSKTAGFSIHDKKFINLRMSDALLPDIIKDGYYERISVSPTAFLYIKHHKHRREIIQNDMVYDSFSDQNQLVLADNDNIVPVNSKKEIIRNFPNQKRAINEYYQLHRERSKTNPSDFTTELLKYIINLGQSQPLR